MLFSADIKIPVQGYLVDSTGVALNGDQSIKFSIYNVDENGTALWSNQDSVTINVNNGQFSYMLGTTDYIDSTVLENSDSLYLDVKINDELLTPRIELGVESKSVYAYKAENSDKLEGKTLTELKTEVKTEIDSTKLNDVLARLTALEGKVSALESDNTNLKSRLTSLESDNTDLKSRVTALESDNTDLKSRVATLESGFTTLSDMLSSLQTSVNTNTSNITTLQTTVTSNSTKIGNNTLNITSNYNDLYNSDGRLAYFINYLSDRISPLETKTESMSIETVHGYKTVRFTHVNLQVVSGSGTTNGRYSSNNVIDGKGLGNIIIGYNERNNGGVLDSKDGYHNLVSGIRNTYNSYGGFIAGDNNVINAPYATVTGGNYNRAESLSSSVSGGFNTIIASGKDYYWGAGSLEEVPQ
jgi:hypothetical protein